MKYSPLTLLVFGIFPMALASGPTASTLASKPNVLIILADDLGFSDLGSYGGEIETPNLDRLAAKGVRFTQFYNTAKCNTSRVSLLTGMWSNRAGNNSMRYAVTLPEVVSGGGYFTAMTGKWHLQKQPTDYGFDRYFGHLSGATDYFRGNDKFRLNGESFKVPDSGFYTTTAMVDYAIKFLNEARAKKMPWLLYVAFNAPHSPFQPLKEDYEKFLGRYDDGWDASHARRVARQKELGIFGQDFDASPRPDHIPAWEDLEPATKAWEAKRRAAYAALVYRMDLEIGRLLEDMETHGELENTLVIFFSDNGSSPYDRISTGIDREPYEPGSAWSNSTGWAWVSNTPFRYYKQNQFEGGITTPAIVQWPKGLAVEPGSILHMPLHMVDVLPTVSEITGIPIPETFPDREPRQVSGVSFDSILKGNNPSERPPIHLAYGSDRGLRDGDWKIVSFQSQPWELYHIANDRTELNDLAKENPEILSKLVEKWHTLAEEALFFGQGQRGPVATEQTPPGARTHPLWSNYKNGIGSKTGNRKAAGSDD